MSRIIYSPKYNIGFFGLERLHPFDSRKYGRAWNRIQKHFGDRAKERLIKTDRAANQSELSLVHSAEYLKKLRSSTYVAGALELPPVRYLPGWSVDWHVLRPMRWATRGSILAAKAALEYGFAVNMSGGYHHAKPNRGEGFSIYSDIGIAVAVARQHSWIPKDCRVVYIDTDAHQGNGVCHAFLNDKRVFIFDIFNSDIYPCYDMEAKRRIDCEIPLQSMTSSDKYMSALRTNLPGFLDSVGNSEIGMAIYNAGTDVFSNDPLGRLSVSAEAVLERDLFVVHELRRRGIPTMMVLSGGYTKESYLLVADSIIAIIENNLGVD